MTFELYVKGSHGRMLKPTDIRICKASISFGVEICDEIKVVGHVEVYLNRENNEVGFKPTKNDVTGFNTPERPKSKALYLASKTFAGMLPMGTYTAKKEDDMWVIKVDEIAERK